MERRPPSSLTVINRGSISGEVWRIQAIDDTAEIKLVQKGKVTRDKVAYKHEDVITFIKLDDAVVYARGILDGFEKRLKVYKQVETEVTEDEDPEFPTTQKERDRLISHRNNEDISSIFKICPYELCMVGQLRDGETEMVRAFYDIDGRLRLISVIPFAGSWEKSQSNTALSKSRLDFFGNGSSAFIFQGSLKDKVRRRQLLTPNGGKAMGAGYLVDSFVLRRKDILYLEIYSENFSVNEKMKLFLPLNLNCNHQALLKPYTVAHHEIPLNRFALAFNKRA